MRIALLSTCAVATPPIGYGGSELVVAELAKGLVALGHDVTVFATGDSRPPCRRWSHFAEAVWPPDELAELCHASHAWRTILSSTRPYDVVHVNQAASVALGHAMGSPSILTIHHERVERFVDFYRSFPETTYVAISKRQADLLPELSDPHVIHHGLDPDSYPAGAGEGRYLAFLGRFAPEKGPHVAIDVARAAGVPLRMGGGPHPVAQAYFEREIVPRLAGEGVEWLGDVSHGPKIELLAASRGLLFPIDWEEPFGLVMIEAMLVGTPVIAYPRGAAPEVVEDGVTGFLVRDEQEMVRAVAKLGSLDRRLCRARARERWSHLRMAHEYLRVYEHAMRNRRVSHPTRNAPLTARAS